MVADKLIKLLKSTQITVCVVVGIVLTATMLLLFNDKPQNNLSSVKTEILNLAESIRAHYKIQPDYRGLNKQSVINIAPKKLVRNNKIVSAIGKEIVVGQNENGDTLMPSQRNFMISLNNLTRYACENIAVLDIADNNHYILQKIIIKTDSSSTEFEWGGENTLPIGTQQAQKYCKNKNTISWVFE